MTLIRQNHLNNKRIVHILKFLIKGNNWFQIQVGLKQTTFSISNKTKLIMKMLNEKKIKREQLMPKM